MGHEAFYPGNYLTRMADGTVKQINPFTGTEVWTVPGRGSRPLGDDSKPGAPLDPAKHDRHCAFCTGRMLETPPEKSRLIRDKAGWQIVRDLHAQDLAASQPEFRRIPNLFEIVTFEYWQRNFNHGMTDALQSRKHAYLSTETGRRHVLAVIEARLKLAGHDTAAVAAIATDEKLALADAFFGGGHELVIPRRHYVDGALYDNQLASSGTMTPEEHYQYFRFTIEAMRDIYLNNRYVRYVAVFQNWLQPAGASFDHLHKQLVAIDGRSAQIEREIALLRRNPNLYNDAAVNFASYRNLVFAENEHAIAFADFGHRFPALAIYSKSDRSQPWNHSPEQVRGMSDLVHACHAAMGAGIPCNEEWYYKPPDADVPMPWRILIKWRISNPAGFEGGTGIYVNTIDPESLRDRMVPRLFDLKNEGKIAVFKIAFECNCVPNCLKYNPAVRDPSGPGEALFPPLSGAARGAD